MTDQSTAAANKIIDALTHSHDRLAAAVEPLGPDDVTKPAFPSEWSIADTLSHLGSGAEIWGLLLSAGQHGHAGPGQADYQAIWNVWNAKQPADQARDAVTTDGTFVKRLQAMSPAERERFAVTVFGGVQDLAGFLGMRLNEHTLHTWDVLVALDPAATLSVEASELLLPSLGSVATRTGQPSERAVSLRVYTTDPDDIFVLTLGTDGVELSEGADNESTSATATMPAEALIRLVAGRMDPDHTPSVTVEGVELDQLRQAFPGF